MSCLQPMCSGRQVSDRPAVNRTWSGRTIHKVKNHVVRKNTSMRCTLPTKGIQDNQLQFSTTTNIEQTVEKSRWDEKQKLFDDLFTEVQDLADDDSVGLEKLILRNSSSVPTALKTMKSVFTSASKFQNNLKGGIYLAALIHHDNKVLVTGQGKLPLIEIDSDYAGTELSANMHWMTKVSSMWQNAKVLQSDYSRSTDTSASKQFRTKFLSVVISFQKILGLYELGQIHYQPIKDPATGSLIIVAVQTLKNANGVSTAHTKWRSIQKLEDALHHVKTTGSTDVLMQSAMDMISFEQSSSMQLPQGLYLGYMKLTSSLDGISIKSSKLQPNVLPNVKVRTDNKVSREEWDWLKCLKNADVDSTLMTSSQAVFCLEIMTACDQLFLDVGVTQETAGIHRFYDLEVIDLGSDVTFIVVLPPIDDVCSGPENVEARQSIVPSHALPVHVFETIHQRAYHRDQVQRYNQLSCYFSTRLDSAHQHIRQALSNDDVTASNNKLLFYTDKQRRLEAGYQSTRWIIDVIGKSRDTTVCVGSDISKMYSVISSLDAS